MGSTTIEIAINLVKTILVFLMMVQAVPILVWLERRGSAFIQNRFGPNRVGPLGLVQLLADAVKFLKKEDFVPEKGNRFLFYCAPVFAMIPGAIAYMAIPMSVPLVTESYTFLIQGYEINVGIVFILGISSLAAYTILMAGWGSGSKFSLMGALRASAQIISYELALGLAIVGVILLYGTFNLAEMIQSQSGSLNFQGFGYTVAANWLPNWGIFYQPIGALLFFAATFAESNRLPFDLAEGEAELVAGFHTEYGGFKMLMFFIGEYAHMMVASGLMVTFFFGGYSIWNFSPEEVHSWIMNTFSVAPFTANVLNSIIHFLSYTIKFALFLWIFIHVRWTLPRFRYDQLMDLGWKTMLPWALANSILTAAIIFIGSHFTL
ncbi:MAG: NADH-quinone oxidoreductase subunit H [Bdellovibrionales bacterium RIFCSPHIGHO2_01_FULL_40_29]|nr:MAG: NADH-quinone oxidoreductase subunit H [Bdellovibrionales bacterium RIFCSPHIGHO2_01_FULL_40_29]OFZ34896.1 MAG: NADH-quinone oxidoreductase subunit H [Bdellovibrionales bacterium RIFCSPHIGHO2_02_FULL_40_15]